MAGIVEQGNLLGDSAVPLASWSIPGAYALKDLVLVTDARTNKSPRPWDGALDAFVRIQTPEDVLRFVEDWGSFNLCSEHVLPTTHSLSVMRGVSDYRYDPDVDDCFDDHYRDLYEEPIYRYLEIVGAARALLTIAAGAVNGEAVKLEDWVRVARVFMAPLLEGRELSAWRPSFGGREFVANVITEWLRVGNVTPILTWQSDPAKLAFQCGVFGTLGMQLLNACTRGQAVAICDGCGNPYIRKGRRPQAGRRNYCPDCGSRAWLRDAQRAYQERKKRGEA